MKKDYYADLVIFDPKSIKDNADYSHPFELATRIKCAVVNGKIAIDNGRYNAKF